MNINYKMVVLMTPLKHMTNNAKFTTANSKMAVWFQRKLLQSWVYNWSGW